MLRSPMMTQSRAAIMILLPLLLLQLSYLNKRCSLLVHGWVDKEGVKRNYPYGQVVIVLSRGRSGSGMMCRMAENVADAQRYVLSNELFGGTESKMLLIENPKQYMKHYLQDLRKKHPSNIIGFKWKPYADTPGYDEAFKWVGYHNFSVLFQHRNPLDEFISRTKHHVGTISPHCRNGDTACLQAARTLKVSLDLEEMMQFLHDRQQDVLTLRKKLDEFKVRYLEVKYEDLAHGEKQQRMQQLQRVADFFVPSARAVTWRDFDIGIEPTSSYEQASKVDNYAAVRDKLHTSGYADLLH